MACLFLWYFRPGTEGSLRGGVNETGESRCRNGVMELRQSVVRRAFFLPTDAALYRLEEKGGSDARAQ